MGKENSRTSRGRIWNDGFEKKKSGGNLKFCLQTSAVRSSDRESNSVWKSEGDFGKPNNDLSNQEKDQY